MSDDVPITLIGHPWSPIGMGEGLRQQLRACHAVGLRPAVMDIFRYTRCSDPAHAALVGADECEVAGPGIRVFNINGDEVEPVLAAFAERGGKIEDGINVIAPAWELPAYPKPWAKQLGRFDEIWAMSDFVRDSLAASGLTAHTIGQAVQAEPGPMLSRRQLGIRESAFVLLHFFDLSSFAERKNPQAVLALFASLRAAHPFADLQLVLKVKNGERGGEDWAGELAPDPQVKLLTAPLDSLGVRSLVNACDCFVSLHRAEGFGRGLGEAMALGRLALGTAWSGNLDFMRPDNSLLVDFRMVALKPEDYPHGEGQNWADPDIDHAARLLAPILADPARGAALAERGRRGVLLSHGNRAVGLRMLDRIEALAARPVQAKPSSRARRRR